MSDIADTKVVRLDKWLKISRIYKTRNLAIRACDEGKVKVNGRKSKPGRIIKIGDQIIIKVRSKYRTYDVLDVIDKSISKQDAKLLYNEHKPKLSEESKELYELLQEWDKHGRRKFKGRPTKKERRELEKFKGHE